MAGVSDHTELRVWQLCDDLCGRVSAVIDRPAFARYPTLREQIEEAAESPCPNIAEGFARYLPRDNARFVRIARGSLTELIVHLGRAKARRLISEAERDGLCSLARRARGAATNYIVYLQSATAPEAPRKEGNEPEP